MNETQYNREQIAVIKGAGTFAYKTSDSFQVGIPDIYICGGKWIESKLVRASGKRSFSIAKGISGAQHKWMQRLSDNGDKCWVSVLIQLPKYKFFICDSYASAILWPEGVHPTWIEKYATEYNPETLRAKMREIINV